MQLDFTFAELLKGFRKRQGITQAQLAYDLKVHINTISAWERSKYLPDKRELVLSVADALFLNAGETDQLLAVADFPQEYGTQPKPPSALYQLRAPSGNFVGRDTEIEQLLEVFSSINNVQGTAVVISGIRGMGGIGKTELGYVISQRLSSVFPDGQIMLNLRGTSESPLSPVQALQIVSRSFDREIKLPNDIDSLIVIYRSFLTNKHVLVFADDAHNAAQVRPLLPPSGSALLITSRQHFQLLGMTAIDLGTLSPADSEQLLLRICPRIGEHAALLAHLCGYLPLALRVSAEVLANDRTLSVSKYMNRLTKNRLLHLRDPETLDDSEASVEASLNLSFRALSETAKIVLRQCSVFSSSFDESAAIAVIKLPVDSNSIEIDQVLGQLYRRSLIEYNPKDGRFDLHDLIRVFAIERLTGANSVRQRHARYYASLMWKLGREQLRNLRGDVYETLEAIDREIRHMEQGQQYARTQPHTKEKDEILIEYAFACADYFDMRGHFDQWLDWTDVGRKAAQRRKRFKEAATLLMNSGIAYFKTDRYNEAIAAYQEVISFYREFRIEQELAIVLGNLGVVYMEQGQVSEAIASYHESMEISQRIGDIAATARQLGNIGAAYHHQDQYIEALDYYHRSLDMKRKIHDEIGTAITSWNIGELYEQQEDFLKALQFMEEAVVILEHIKSPYLEKYQMKSKLEQIRTIASDGG